MKSITTEYAKDNLRAYVESITKKSTGGNYVCPLCGSGTGKNKTGAFSIYDNGKAWKCFSCEEGGDIFDLVGKVEHLTDFTDQKKWVCDHFHIGEIEIGEVKREDIGEVKKEDIGEITSEDIWEVPELDEEEYKKTVEEVLKDFPKIDEEEYNNAVEEIGDLTDFFLQANKDLDKTDYPKNRGLSEEILNRFQVGFVEAWRNPKAPDTVPTSPRLIIPNSKSSYLARDTREEIPEKQKPYTKSKVGKQSLFNFKAIYGKKGPVFITEGEIDALSVMEIGPEAIGLGSVSNAKSFLEAVKKKRPTQPLIISLDNDGKGKEKAEQFERELKDLNVFCLRFNISGESKDPNEALTTNREQFEGNLEKAIKAVRAIYREGVSTQSYIQDFINGISNSVNTPVIPTGFPNLDTALDGGLYEGLYTIGAISSLGKTTLVTQIADQIAQSGKDIYLFSLEMARSEIMAKSISRHTVQIAREEGIKTNHAKTARGITDGKRYEKYCKEEKDLIERAITEYGAYADHIFISEGIGDISVETIRKKVKQHIFYTGKAPVMIVDYLQIIAPYNEKYSDKQNIDRAVVELKRISRDYKAPVIVVSSFNRENYENHVSFRAFKESGAIEYSSDILIGLQLKGAGVKGFDASEAKKKDPREIELVILKNRNGKQGVKVLFDYYPMFNLFEETEGKVLDWNDTV